SSFGSVRRSRGPRRQLDRCCDPTLAFQPRPDSSVLHRPLVNGALHATHEALRHQASCDAGRDGRRSWPLPGRSGIKCGGHRQHWRGGFPARLAAEANRHTAALQPYGPPGSSTP
ncbi:unnamed protein product, partial [Prorocentrum cordatum]